MNLSTRLITSLFLIPFLILVASIPGPFPAHAQNGIQVSLSEPDLSQFPRLTTYLDIFTEDGTFIKGLSTRDVTIVENGKEVEILKFQELSPGIQLVFGLNIAPPFAIRDPSGQSRWDYLSQAILAWANQPALSVDDDLSIISNDGLEKTHLTEKDIFAAALESYQPQPRETSSNLNVLNQAIEIASDPSPELGMKKIVFFLTPPPSPEDIAALESLTSLAQANDVRVYPWLISSPAFANSGGAEQLKKMAEETGGEMFTFSGDESIPDLENIFRRLRGTYLVSYQSEMNRSSSQQIQAQIEYDDQILSTTTDFDFAIQPPNPILISPPPEVHRKSPQPEGENYILEEYLPKSLDIQVIIEFPDGLERPLKHTILKVDGQVEDTNTREPFTRFTWDLSKYQNTGVHYLTIKVEDQIGLSKTSIQTPIKVIISQPELKISSLIKDHTGAFWGLLGIIMGVGILLILILTGRIHPREVIGKRRTYPDIDHDPSSAAWETYQDKSDQPGKDQASPSAYLIPEGEPAGNLFQHRLPIYDQEVTIGNEPASSTISIKDPSVSTQHAQLIRLSQENYLLKDEGSLTGTWINYNQIIPDDPRNIRDGDLLHIGQVAFRFQINNSQKSVRSSSSEEPNE